MPMSYTHDNPPPIVQKAPEDVIPYSDGYWCSIADGQPFVNEVCIAREGDREGVAGWWFMLDSHNFVHCAHGDTIGVVEKQQKGLEL